MQIIAHIVKLITNIPAFSGMTHAFIELLIFYYVAVIFISRSFTWNKFHDYEINYNKLLNFQISI